MNRTRYGGTDLLPKTKLVTVFLNCICSVGDATVSAAFILPASFYEQKDGRYVLFQTSTESSCVELPLQELFNFFKIYFDDPGTPLFSLSSYCLDIF